MHLSPAARPASREGEQDLVALELVGVEAADVIAQRCFDAGDAQIEGIRYGTNPDRQKLLEEASLVASGGQDPSPPDELRPPFQPADATVTDFGTSLTTPSDHPHRPKNSCR
ncbi:MAG: hypothetical protein QOE04_2193, partial [Mycobacterium sp.]|nr:hypothetical protein [Mycobacterium sp.]